MKTLMLILTIVALLVFGCTKATEKPVEPVGTPVPTPTTPTQPTQPAPEPVAETPAVEAKLISDVKCENGVISIKLTNIGKTEVDITKVLFTLNAVTDKTPGCEAETLALGASTVCSEINAIKATKGSVVLVKLPSGETQYEKTCS